MALTFLPSSARVHFLSGTVCPLPLYLAVHSLGEMQGLEIFAETLGSTGISVMCESG